MTPPRTGWSTGRLVWLACLLPLLGLLAAQLAMFCDEQGDCAVPVRFGGWLTIPLLVAWVAVLAALAWRLWRASLGRARRG